MISYLIAWVLRFSALILFVLVFGSVKTYFGHRVPKRFELYNLRPDQVMSEWFELAGGFSDQLFSLGFVRTGFIAVAPPRRINVELLIHAQLPISASVAVLLAGEQRRAYAEFKTRFDDDYVVCTSNLRGSRLFNPRDGVEMHRSTADWLRQVLDEHLASVRAASVGRMPLPAPQTETAASVMDAEERAVMHQVDTGLLRESGDGKTLRYTARGAMRSCFRVWRRFGFLRPQNQQPAPKPSTLPARRAA